MWVPKRKDFTENPQEDIYGYKGFRAREASYPCFYTSRGRDSSYVGLFSTFGLRKKGFLF